MTKGERLRMFFEKLIAAAAARTANEAFDLIASTMNAVEAEHASEDDRMYPPSGDFWYPVAGREDLDLYRQAGHDTIIRDNGAILIRVRRTGVVVLEKPGHDGRKVDL